MILSPGETIALFNRQHCRAQSATCCARLATLLRRVVTRWMLRIELARKPWRNIVARTWPNEYNSVQYSQMLYEKDDHFQT